MPFVLLHSLGEINHASGSIPKHSACREQRNSVSLPAFTIVNGRVGGCVLSLAASPSRLNTGFLLHAARTLAALTRLLPTGEENLAALKTLSSPSPRTSWTVVGSSSDRYSITPILSQTTAVSSIHLADSSIHLLTPPHSLASDSLVLTSLAIECLGFLSSKHL